MDKKKKSLNAIATEIEYESIDSSQDGESQVSYKTIERRFKKFIKVSGVDIEKIKNENGEIYFEENDAVILKALLRESIDKDGFVYKLIKGKDEGISFNQIKNFMDNINDFMIGKIDDQEREIFMSYIDQSLKYSALMELHNIYNLLECLNANLATLTYPNYLTQLIKLRKNIENQFINSTLSVVKDILSLKVLEMTNNQDDFDISEDISKFKNKNCGIGWEYEQRDIEIKKFLDDNPLIKQHIEQKIKVIL